MIQEYHFDLKKEVIKHLKNKNETVYEDELPDISSYKKVNCLIKSLNTSLKILKIQINYDVHDERFVKLSKQQRRRIYGDIDNQLLKTLPNLVTPYVSLTIPVEIFIQIFLFRNYYILNNNLKFYRRFIIPKKS